MVTVIPYIPEFITVHLGTPRQDAPNVTVSYLDYLKNVAASEIYPTWELSAIRANVLAINSYALNRVYTEYYRSRGYAFDITNTTAYDQAYVDGRSTFDNIDRLVDALFDTYIRRSGFVEPLAARFCNGTTSVCDGLSQWGSQSLAQEGYNSVQILQAYYGEDVELVAGAAVRPITPSYPGRPLRLGSVGDEVTVIQVSLNRIAQNYPAIPKISPVDGFFSRQTEQAVLEFQRIFHLAVDGIVGEATWYELVQIYVAVKRLTELQSEGQTYYGISWSYPEMLEPGDEGAKVSHLQYMLSVVSAFNEQVPETEVDGRYGEQTREAVESYQRYAGLPQTGTVDRASWDSLYDSFYAIERTVFRDPELFPFPQTENAGSIRQLQQQLRTVSDAYPSVQTPGTSGQYDAATQRSVRDWQRFSALPSTGRPDVQTRTLLADAVGDLRYASSTRRCQFPGYDLTFGQSDPGLTGESRMNSSLLPVGQPIRCLQFMLRTLAAKNPALKSVIPDGIYGADTMQAVSAFQKEAGLPVTGVTGRTTWDAVRDAYEVSLANAG